MGTVKKSGSGDGAAKASVKISSILSAALGGMALGGAAGGLLGALGTISELKQLTKQLQKLVLLNENKGLQKKLKKKIDKLLKGLKASLKGTKLGCCMFGGDPVNLCTGNFITMKEDLMIKGLFSLRFTRFYNAMDKNKGALGIGWMHNYEIKLSIGEEEITLFREDGSQELYVEGKNGEYICTFGGYKQLRKSAEEITLKSINGVTYLFDLSGQIKEMRDLKGNAIRFYHENHHLIRVENETEGYLSFSYGENGYLAKVADHTGRQVCLSYDGDCLCAVQGVDQTTVRYEYDKLGLITAIENQNQVKKIQNTYDQSERILSQKYPDGGIQTYEYDDDTNTVVFTEQNGNQIQYIHDEKFRHIETRYEDGVETFTYNSNNRRTSITDKMGNVTRYTYDDAGNVTSIIDAMQNKSTITYNALNLPISLKGPCGEVTTMEYDAKGNLIQTEDSLGQMTQIDYTSFGRPEKVKQADDSILSITYEEKGNIKTITDELGNVTTYDYDALNRVSKTTDGRGYSTSYVYDNLDRIIEVTNQLGKSRHYHYNKVNKITSIVDFDGSSMKWTYDACDRVTSYTNKNGFTSHYQYDQMGNVIEKREPNGAKTKYHYNKQNHLDYLITPTGQKICYEYDRNGNQTKIIGENEAIIELIYNEVNVNTEILFPNGTSEKMTYDASGRLTEVIARNDGVHAYAYDKLGQLISEEDALGGKTEYTYSPLGKVLTKKDAAGRITTHEYYPGGLLKRIQYPDKTWETFEYDENKNIAKRINSAGMEVVFEYDPLNRVERMCSNLGQEKKFSYDAMGNITSITDPRGNVTTYEYSKSGKLTRVVDAVGHQVAYGYDSLDELIEIEESVVAKASEKTMREVQKINHANHMVRRTTYKRDVMGQITEVLDPLGNREEYQYDKLGRMIKKRDKEGYETLYAYSEEGSLEEITYQDGKSVMLSYDALGQLIRIQDWLGTTSIENDLLGRAESITDYRGKTVSYEWGSMDEKRAMRYPNGTEVHYEYDNCLRLAKLTAGKDEFEYSYDEMGHLQKKKYPNGVETTYSFLSHGKIGEMVHSDALGIIDQYKFDYDEMGNQSCVEKYRRDLPEDSGIYTFDYDSGNRLTDVWKEKKRLRHFEYDAFGNRTIFEQLGERVSYDYNEQNQLITEEGMYKHHPVRRRYTYDKRGNQIAVGFNQKDTIKYAFDVRNRLESVEAEKTPSLQFCYDGFGHRIARKQNQVETFYTLDYTKDHNNLLTEEMEGRERSYLWDNQILGLYEGQAQDDVSYYVNDEMGSPLRVLGIDGMMESSYGYSEFGTQDIFQEKRIQPFGFTGYQKETGTELYYAQARYYNEGNGRFISEDIQKGQTDMPKSFNVYTYCYNLPTVLVDPNGEWSEEDRVDGIVAHTELQAYFKMQCAMTGTNGETEYHISSGVNNPTAVLYSNPKSGTGRADIVEFRGNEAQVYEIKSFAGAGLGREQIQAYINGINSSTAYHAVRGTTFNPDGLELPYPGDPTKTIKYYTDYETDPGIIKYSIKKKKVKEPEPVTVPVPVTEPKKDGNLLKGLAWGAATIGCGILALALWADDATGVGVADDGFATFFSGAFVTSFTNMMSACGA